MGGSFSGPLSERGLIISKDGFSYRLATTAGSTAKMVAALENSGSHAVRISSVGAGPGTSEVQWSTYRTVPEGSTFGVDAPWRSFPATIPPHGTIRLLLTVRRPADCRQFIAHYGNPTDDGSLAVHWRSLLHTNTSYLQVLLVPLTIC
ncbi:hypothetical protein [Allobranchiibius sp. CTAmp26]|uniref:hypothetical protein n=1 Tax=Allobranchiibius sp. CTAmp26 TaxID=2815214 RepID=UPI001AA17938|nr:hypothetical protein [Allobranchiibius sp. CTAmp26]MBO1753893.1 hypothetical protein [Allobranchiibius sp. CTAmp26]